MQPSKVSASQCTTKICPIPPRDTIISSALSIRGGSDDEDDEENAENEVSAASNILSALGKGTLTVFKALKRSLGAAFAPEEDDHENEEKTALVKIGNVLQRMWTAAFNPDIAGSVKSKSKTNKAKTKDEGVSDFGEYLADAYDVSDQRSGALSTSFIGGSLTDALGEARSKARLLVVFIPASKKKSSDTATATKSLLSQEVSKTAEKKSRKKSKEDTGSFLLWGAKADSSEAVTATKRLKTKQPKKGDKKPVLAVVYAGATFDSSGKPKMVPKLLAQHHCSPPPNPEKMAAWLNALRKRHAKQYNAMLHNLKEAQFYKERKEGYKSSVESDIIRQVKEKKDEEERLAKEEAEKERLAALEERRKELLENLPEEPPKEGSMTIALRFSDGRAGQRRFTPETDMAEVFNWVDAVYKMERELVVLTTMNGKLSFEWDGIEGKTLQESGLGRMAGLRVMEKKVEEQEPKEEDGKVDEDDGDDES